MARYTMRQRKALSNEDFAVPSKAPGPCSLPVPDKDHCEAAKSLCHKCPPGSCEAVARKCGGSEESSSEDTAS